ncbi:1,4-alpha-glucan branching protein GlgB [Pseudoalteromonas sp. MEBiC 03607]|jgi:1,4-alpha-glucan branching enzyme|uniref:1,4-alpha-glucan branching protein GlgB n=1 Tax=unclassified Pseudoalteromonas TaxID=194690 RepID=UPI000C4ACDCC|nr:MULTISPECIES: 1,4-alpha-glucan branching protein GlgB [unclassified Pseudoalteromonas]MBD58364.1 1,4-alpha-glucan branching enzyme [Pseudoalteromonas sp.]MCF2901893.1 1,4-alpha-glucan branching protein GlgB [Pseudoalteromonas sp. OFAV1]MCO7250379.1 1,4-alpha-glucan branching protein GlgB [Pseudoalteromonas sp. Ps84H-4]TGV16972.1 1,4-alpha-glucan branching protein GlgB [Pseudoalteromonas sp. MEBiC 03607]|tara:strand:- start:11166 stop:13403 length:2238 start_codon:yes stop_codon:yes gene_type:complete
MSSRVGQKPFAEPMVYQAHIDALSSGCYKDPFSFLGPHKVSASSFEIRCFLPGASQLSILQGKQVIEAKKQGDSDLFIATVKAKSIPDYQLDVNYGDGSQYLQEDEYRFTSTLDEQAMYLFNEGSLEHAYQHFGAHFVTQQGVEGVRFTVWAPNASSVSVIGEFNYWQRNRHFMRFHPASGVWELFIPGLKEHQCYKFAISTPSGEVLDKADPFAFKMQQAPGTASVLQKLNKKIQLSDEALANRAKRNSIDAPISIYEVHAGSWQRRDDEGRYLTWRELADNLIPYTKDLGFTHLQLMPISEYPFDGSWGYQPVGLFAPTSRYGSFEDFVYFIEQCHDADLGIILDWVPGHFPSDPHGLHRFDGTHLYEHADVRQGFHPDWNTYIYNYDRAEVRSFLIANAMYWLHEFGIDGLRVDAVASMLYLDYSREEGQWIPNQYGGRENLGAIECLKQVNLRCYGKNPGIMMVAEESTAWPGVTRQVDHGGLGFGYKWNMGWMNDSLHYMQRDSLYRAHHHHEMTFSMVYAYSENYILPLSHDEVVHGKGSLIEKMPGDDWQKFANLRAYYAFMWAHPGKKLLFMGAEIAQRSEWNHDQSIDWHLLEHVSHSGMQQTIKQLNNIYTTTPALYEQDTSPAGFAWLDSSNAEQSMFSFIRYAKHADDFVLVISNLTPQVYHDYVIGVPKPGRYQVIFNSDNEEYFGSGVEVSGNTEQLIFSQPTASHGYNQSISVSLPGLATIYLKKVNDES